MDRVYSELHFEAYQWTKHCVNHSEELAADILQTVYLKILNGKAKYDGKALLKTWLFSVIRYTAMDHYRGVKKQEPLEVVKDFPTDDDTNQLDKSFYADILNRLSENQSKVLLLVFYHDYTLETIAEIMDLSIGTVRTHYDRGKKKLKKILEKENKTNYEY